MQKLSNLLKEIDCIKSDIQKATDIINKTTSLYAKKDQYRHIQKLNKKLNRLYAIRRNIYRKVYNEEN